MNHYHYTGYNIRA